jgi:hypothetical protein
MAKPISVEQFGTLYHGTNVPNLTEINQSQGRINYGAMPRIHGWNFATNQLQTAIDYARSSANTRRYRDTVKPVVVYEVTPRRKKESWGPDPDSGPFGWNDGPKDKREALEYHENDSEVSLRFKSPLKAQREVFVEDKAKDITNSWNPEFHTMGESFS